MSNIPLLSMKCSVEAKFYKDGKGTKKGEKAQKVELKNVEIFNIHISSVNDFNCPYLTNIIPKYKKVFMFLYL